MEVPLLSSTTAHPTPVYAQLPVFQYQTFEPGGFSFTSAPLLPPSKSSKRYYRPVTNATPKPEDKPEQTQAEPLPVQTPAEPPSEPAKAPEGQN